MLEQPPQHPKEREFPIIPLALAFILLFGAGIAIFISMSRPSNRQSTASPTPTATATASSTPTATATASPTPSTTPTATPTATTTPTATPSARPTPSGVTPAANSTVKSPLVVKGTVPAGWMFEGGFPIKLLDANRQEITSIRADEELPGTWSSGGPIKFTATLTFTTSAKKGFIVLQRDNASGLPENDQSFEIPVNF